MKSLAVVKIGSLKDADPAKRGKVQLRDIPEDPVTGEEVKIKVAYCAICGSDPHSVEGIFGQAVPFGLGHELSGVVVEVGSAATQKGLKPGDRVAGNFLRFCGTCYYCQNGQQQFCEHADESNRPGMSEYVTWHESQVYKLPDDVSLRNGCMLEPVSVVVRMMDKLQPKIGQRVAISGSGPIGLLAVQMFKMMGASSLTVIEPIEARRALAKQFGADHLIDPLAEDVVQTAQRITEGIGFDIVLDVSGVAAAAVLLPHITAKGGTVCYSAMYPADYEMPLGLTDAFFRNEITLTGTYISPYTFPHALQILPRMQLDAFTQTVFPLEAGEAAFAAQVSGEHVKVLILCNEDLAHL
ncbi:MAG: alcohol dehydrogenase catalytic domain-containing protein [Clostridiales Family XIII bacterium]|nr:alcohol dehydrogenase catalytic domain-containing protein [Clostridiales Family XIII bacterium]